MFDGERLEADPELAAAVDEAVLTGDAPPRTIGADPHDFAALYMRHRSSFAALARRYLRNPADIEEVLQEAFLKLFLAMPELETEVQAIAYCRRTVTNLCIDRYRADSRRPGMVGIDELPYEPAQQDDDGVVAAEDAAVVREALAQLSPLHRAALIKREIEEKPLPVIAAELGIEERNVKHVLLRARRSLRRLLVGTSVDPETELSMGEVVALASRRAMEASDKPLKAALAVLILLVSVLGVRGFGPTPTPIVAGDVPRASDGAIRLPGLGEGEQRVVVRERTGPLPSGGAPSSAGQPGAAVPVVPGAPEVPRSPGGPGLPTPGAPALPTPGQPMPEQPAPGEPVPQEPVPQEPVPSEPVPSEPAPQEPAPQEPAPSEPAPQEPAPRPVPPRRGGPALAPGTFAVSGAGVVDERLTVTSEVKERGSGDAMAARTAVTFEADTSAGPLRLDQHVTFNGARIDVDIQPQLLVGGQMVEPQAVEVAEYKRLAGDDAIEVDVRLALSPAGSQGTAGKGKGLAGVPKTLDVTLLLTPELDEVLAETVQLGELHRPQAPSSPEPQASLDSAALPTERRDESEEAPSTASAGWMTDRRETPPPASH